MIAFPFSYETLVLIIPVNWVTSWFTCSSQPEQVIPLILNSTFWIFDWSVTIVLFSVFSVFDTKQIQALKLSSRLNKVLKGQAKKKPKQVHLSQPTKLKQV